MDVLLKEVKWAKEKAPCPLLRCTCKLTIALLPCIKHCDFRGFRN